MPLHPTRRSVLRSLTATTATLTLRNLTLGQSSPAPSHALDPSDPSSPHDPLRPAFHYLPARNWMNDPCAPIFWRGQYHMFHQYNPHAAVWGDMHWAHATSPDMVHWKRLPVAVAPTPGGPDSEGVFTGSSLLHNGTPAIIYTGVQSVPHAEATLSDGTHNFRETQLLATSADPSLNTWTKRPQPVIPHPPPGIEVTGFRDPTPFHHLGRQYLVVGSGQRGIGGIALLYRAPSLGNGADDLTHWEYLHPLTQGAAPSLASHPASPNPTKSTPTDIPKDPVDTGEMWECPDFFALDGRHVLIYSTVRKTFWQVGDLDPTTLTFHATATGLLDQGRSFYAPKTQLDAHGNRILWGWLAETRTDPEMAAAGWSGMLSLPRVLTVRDGQLRQRPLPALQQLRRPAAPNGPVHELSATLNRQPAAAIVQPAVFRDSFGPLLSIDNSPEPPEGRAATFGIPHDLPLQGPASIHAFFDNSVLELFLNDRLCVTHRFYRRDPKAPIATLNLPGSYAITDLKTYSLQPIWPA